MRACPQCGICGLDHLISRQTDRLNDAGNPWYEVVCGQCGHIYGAVASRLTTTPRRARDEATEAPQDEPPDDG